MANSVVRGGIGSCRDIIWVVYRGFGEGWTSNLTFNCQRLSDVSLGRFVPVRLVALIFRLTMK